MAKVVVTDSKLQDVANSIRTKTGSTDTMTLEQMPSKIDAIPAAEPDDSILIGNLKMQATIGPYEDLGSLYIKKIPSTLKDSSNGLLQNQVFLTNLTKVSNINTPYLQRFFENCNTLSLDDFTWIQTPDTGKVNFYNMFYKCYKLTSIDLSHLHASSLTHGELRDLYGFTANCASLEYLNISGINTEGMIDFGGSYAGMVKECSKLTNIVWPAVWDLSACSNSYSKNFNVKDCPLTRDSIVQLFNALVDATGEDYKGQKSIQIKSTTYDSLSEEDLAIATNKGYTITK